MAQLTIYYNMDHFRNNNNTVILLEIAGEKYCTIIYSLFEEQPICNQYNQQAASTKL